MSEKTNQIFVRSSGTDEMWFHCGSTAAEVKRSVANYLEQEFHELLNGELTIEHFKECLDFKVQAMTAEEVEAIPDC